MKEKNVRKMNIEHTHSQHEERCCTELIFQINVSSIDDAMNFDEFRLAKRRVYKFCIELAPQQHPTVSLFFLLGILCKRNRYEAFWLTHAAMMAKEKGPRRMNGLQGAPCTVIHCTIRFSI